MKTTIISLGGSLIVPGGIDVAFLRTFQRLIQQHIVKPGRRVVIVAGGGAVSRQHRDAAKKLSRASNDELDRIGIQATKLNAELVRVMFGKLAHSEVLPDPDTRVRTSKKVLVGAGWKPGWSSDNAAVHLAKTYGAKRVINVTNIAKVYTRDPQRYRSAQPVDDLTWAEYLRIIPKKWEAGLNTPFDPVASRTAKKLGLDVLIINGARCTQLRNVLAGRKFTGTTIHS